MSNILKEMKHRTNKLKTDSNTPTFGLSARTSARESCSYLSTYHLMKVVGGFMVFCWRFLVFVGGFLFFCWRFLAFCCLFTQPWISLHWDNLTSDLSKSSNFLHTLFSTLSRKYLGFLFHWENTTINDLQENYSCENSRFFEKKCVKLYFRVEQNL